MKKTLISLAVLAAFVACNKDQVIDQKAPEAIRFGNVFVDKATRAACEGSSYTIDNLTEFEVYGYLVPGVGDDCDWSNIVTIFNFEKVSKVNGEWSYNPAHTQYWIPGNTYYFEAFVDCNVSDEYEEGGETKSRKITELKESTMQGWRHPEIFVYDASKQRDILYAWTQGLTCEDGAQTVQFTFRHLMSKAKFTVKNTMATSGGYSYKVKDIKITNAALSSDYCCADHGWNRSTGSYTLTFGHAIKAIPEGGVEAEDADFIKPGEYAQSNFERLLIPTYIDDRTTTTIHVEFTCELYQESVVGENNDPVLIQTTTKTVSATTRLNSGHAYNFVISLGNPGEPITFDVVGIEGWNRDHDYDGKVDEEDDVAAN